MARIPYMEYEQAPEETKAIYDGLTEMYGRVYNIYKILGHHPEALKGLLGIGSATYRSQEIDPQLAELVYLYTSTLNQCHY